LIEHPRERNSLRSGAMLGEERWQIPVSASRLIWLSILKVEDKKFPMVISGSWICSGGGDNRMTTFWILVDN
jgi:hypothetical protein